MNTVVFYTLSACAGGTCPNTVVQAAPAQPVPVVIYQTIPVGQEVKPALPFWSIRSRMPILPIFRPQVIVVR